MDLPTESDDGASPRAGAGRVQTAWRSYRDFRELHATLASAVHAAAAATAATHPSADAWLLSAFPAAEGVLRGVLGALTTTPEARAEARRAALDRFVSAAVSHPVTGKLAALRKFLRPGERPDWPEPVGPIDLAVHDLPHESSATEWWYYNTHFAGPDGKQYSAFAAFFRVVKHVDKATGKKSYAHALNWAISDVSGKRYVQECVLDRDSPEIVRKQLDTGKVVRDPRLLRSYCEVLDRGNVPLPDRMFSPGRDARVATGTLDLDFESGAVRVDAAGRYALVCTTPDGKAGINLVFTPSKAPVRHGLDGVVKGHDGDDMFYYCISRCAVGGSFTLDGVTAPVAPGGQGWYDHEFGGLHGDDEVRIMNYAWSWAALQMDNGCELSVAMLVDPRTTPQRLMETRAVVVAPDGSRSQPTDLSFTDVGGSDWTSVRTFNVYPTAWSVAMPSVGIDLQLRATFADQEFVTLIAKPGFWEGRVEVTGTWGGAAVTGVGYVERNGYTTLSELDRFFKAVGRETRRAVTEVYPDAPMSVQAATDLIASKDTTWYLDGADLQKFHDGIVAPVRYITDMGGKSWRSYGALACIDIVGGDARKYVRWLSMPEFLHVGSLIIDDIEDRSLKRRGVDCAHVKFGEPIAINAGCAAYFQGQQLLVVPGLSPEQLNAVYDYYFAALRAGHAGQALDIAGLGDLMDGALAAASGGALGADVIALAEARIIAIHRLKTAVPAASLARMGALVGGGSAQQIEAIGRYYESIGIAFQIMDDVLNLRGIYSGKADAGKAGTELKTRGEDITAGKVTIPVVKAMSRLPLGEMRALWEVIKTCPADPAVVGAVIDQLEACGAIDACILQAHALVEDSYALLQPLVPDSFSKIMLRAFGWFVSEQAAPLGMEAPGGAGAAPRL